MKEIMVAIDGSDGSRAAIDEAVELAAPLGAHVTFVSVRKPPSSLLGTPNYECRLARDLGVARATVDAALGRRVRPASRLGARSSRAMPSTRSSASPTTAART